MRVFGNDFKKQGVTFCALIDECVGEKVSFSPGAAMFVRIQVISMLKGLFTIFLFLVRSHILNSNGVWYS